MRAMVGDLLTGVPALRMVIVDGHTCMFSVHLIEKTSGDYAYKLRQAIVFFFINFILI